MVIDKIQKATKKRVSWTTIFSAKRDNNGEAVPADEFIRVLKKLIKQDERHGKIAVQGFSQR